MSSDANQRVQEKIAARDQAVAAIELLREQAEQIPEHARELFWKCIQEAIPFVAKPRESVIRNPVTTSNRNRNLDLDLDVSVPDSVAEAIEQCDRILSTVDELPEAADDFAAGVQETIRGIRDTISKTMRVTDKQQAALDNMESGCDAWS